jgi:predicted TIM-barrel fold metal-dependent hydrolase
MNENRVDIAVVFPNFNPYETKVENVQEKNDWIAQCVKKHPKQLIGLGLTSPWSGAEMGAKEVERCITELGLKGILLTKTKMMPAGYYVEYLTKIFEKCRELNVPILMNATRPGWNGDDIAFIAKQFPEVTVIMGSMGGHNWEAFSSVEMGIETPNIIFGLSDLYFNPLALTYAIRKMGADRVVWGSHEPYNSQASSLIELQQTKLSKWSKPLKEITEEEFKAVAGENISRILGLGI